MSLNSKSRYFLTLLSLMLLPVIAGCDQITNSLPWHWLTGEKTPSSTKQKTPSLKPPTLLEPVPSPVKPVSASTLAKCRSALAIGKEIQSLTHETNFGKRIHKDAWGRNLTADPQLIVLHETVLNTSDTIALFKTKHERDDEQASYHLLIDHNGQLHRIVPDSMRAYGSGMSAFGDMTQRSKPGSVGSINNIALHVSLVSPTDGLNDKDAHSGYTDAQYRALAGQVLLWQGAYGIPMTRVTTHAAVDRSHSRYDPRSFRWDRFDRDYRSAVERCGWKQFDNQQASL